MTAFVAPSMRIARLALLLAALGMAACASQGELVAEKLDPVTSVTVSYSTTPMIFYHDMSGRAAYARNFVDMAAFEVNRMGTYRYYLWLGIWNTIQGVPTAREGDGFESVVIFADGNPLPLEITGWTPESFGGSEPVFVKPVASAIDAYYAVTVDQLRLLAAAQDLRLQPASAERAAYEPWDAQTRARESLRALIRQSTY